MNNQITSASKTSPSMKKTNSIIESEESGAIHEELQIHEEVQSLIGMSEQRDNTDQVNSVYDNLSSTEQTIVEEMNNLSVSADNLTSDKDVNQFTEIEDCSAIQEEIQLGVGESKEQDMDQTNNVHDDYLHTDQDNQNGDNGDGSGVLEETQEAAEENDEEGSEEENNNNNDEGHQNPVVRVIPLEEGGDNVARRNDDNNEHDEDFQRLLALCRHNIMSLYYERMNERQNKPHPSNSSSS